MHNSGFGKLPLEWEVTWIHQKNTNRSFSPFVWFNIHGNMSDCGDFHVRGVHAWMQQFQVCIPTTRAQSAAPGTAVK